MTASPLSLIGEKDIARLKINQSIAFVQNGWLYEIQHFWNHPWAVKGYAKLTSPHIDEGSYSAYAMTPALALAEASAMIVARTPISAMTDLTP